MTDVEVLQNYRYMLGYIQALKSSAAEIDAAIKEQ